MTSTNTSTNTSSNSAVNVSVKRAHVYFETGPNHVLCKVPGLDQDSFPEEFQSTWDKDHVRLPCSDRTYPKDVSMWPEIVRGLSEPILTSQQLSEVMLRWSKGKENGWNINALDAFLNNRSVEEDERVQGTSSDGVLDLSDKEAQADFDEYTSNNSDPEEYDQKDRRDQHLSQSLRHEDEQQQEEQGTEGVAASSGPLKSQFLSTEERQYFFDVILPRMQALALRLPELIKKPIPFLKQQHDSAVTLSQEQIACLLANAFFNTFPCRNTPYKRGRKKKPAFKKDNSGTNVGQGQQQHAAHNEDEDGSEDEENVRHKPKQSNRGGGNGARGGRGGRGGSGTGGRGGGKKNIAAPRPAIKRKAKGPAAQFEIFEDSVVDLSSNVETLTVKGKEKKDSVSGPSTPSSAAVEKEEPEWVPKMPSINFISMFWGEENRTPCTTAQAAKLRCILHYFDRVTTEMPTGTVTYHRQVLKKPAYLALGERLNGKEFRFSSVTIDSTIPIEEAPQGALQLDFANKNIGGGALDHGAVQEEIRFMICPELIISRLFTQQLEANEAVLIKGAERYSNYIGYSKTFEWYSDHQDPTSRDKLGRRMTEICAIDARPFKSRVSRLEQFERHYILREINKALVGFRISPINASEWGLVGKDENAESSRVSSSVDKYRPIATGNWGCGAFGGHLHLKFILQWIAASMCGSFSMEDERSGDDMLYYTFGMHQLKDEIETFVKSVQSLDKAMDPKRIVESIIHYPRRNPAGEIQGFREKSLLEYLSSAIAFVPQA
ncbi:hypothetical protein BC939DRAFT_475921 [Gamsiella multidivaricata]|uniref:uncharacterized protein n=1 Tax=Gamsiella multidivaricata TaxID=101098 RepID=UPI002220EFD1|nr:uncharacterized protein BC939DRAFT_475921 [Gamsiella multidivaricata]KAG0369993.1 hypothetical protein BGZ54_008178 [Gamsiella multidivaricata]KAI7826233.1 hypothetical protein BC939DRAFT_475921 [Gamsiella multidivaricata]